MMEIRAYRETDELGWVRCRTLAFLETAYFDNVLREKEKYNNPSIELVAEIEGQIVGLIDIEYEVKEGTVCSKGTGLGGMIWHIAVHPDFHRQGIGSQLFNVAEKIAKDKGLNRLEAWTRDDDWVRRWYAKNGFIERESYLHVYLDGGQELKGIIQSNIRQLYPVQVFAHYVGENKEEIRKRFKRVHECCCYEKYLV
jgi:GNAT superfamily N-acetyltransferase